MEYFIGVVSSGDIRLIKCNKAKDFESVGEILLENYGKKNDVEKLVNLGEIDELMETYKETKKESLFEKTGDEIFVEEFSSIEELMEVADGEVVYLFNKKWLFKPEDSDEFTSLEEELN